MNLISCSKYFINGILIYKKEMTKKYTEISTPKWQNLHFINDQFKTLKPTEVLLFYP